VDVSIAMTSPQIQLTPSWQLIKVVGGGNSIPSRTSRSVPTLPERGRYSGDALVTSLADESSVQKTIKAASVRWTLSARPRQYLGGSYVEI
jgi:hypothetical protein